MEFRRRVPDTLPMLNRAPYIRMILGLAALLLVGSPAFGQGGVVRSDFAFQLDNAVFDSPEFDFVPRLRGEDTVTLPDTVVQAEAPVLVKGITANVKYKLNAGSKKVFIGAEHMIASEELGARLNINSISVDAIVERIVDRVRVRSRVQGACSNIKIELNPGKARLIGIVKTSVDAQGLPEVSVPWFEITWAPDAWTVAPFSCSGTGGLEEAIRTGLTNYLKDARAFSNEFKKAVAAKMASVQSEVQGWFLKAKPVSIGIRDVSVVLYPKAIVKARGERFQVRGEIHFLFASKTLNETVDVRGAAPSGAGFASESYSLWVPEGLIGALNDFAYRSGLYNLRRMGNEIAAFKTLRESWFSRAFVWPELGNFPDNADFLFDFLAGSRPRISAITDAGDGSLKTNLSGDIRVQTWAPDDKAKSYEKFVQFATPVSGEARVGLSPRESGGADLSIVFATLGLELSYEWDATYARNRLMNSSIGASTIQGELTKSLTTDGFTFSMSPLSLTSAMALSPFALGKTQGWLRIDWK